MRPLGTFVQKLFRFNAGAVVACSLAVLGCTKKDDTSKVTFTLPAITEGVTAKNSRVSSKVVSQSAIHSSSTLWSYPSPTSMNEVKCYAVVVETPGIGTPGVCTKLDGTRVMMPTVVYGPVAGGSTISIEVPSGPKRKIALVAFASDTTTDCMQRVGLLPDMTLLSPPRIVGMVETDLSPGDNDVKMTASMTNATEFENCSNWGASVVMPMPTPGPSATPSPTPTPAPMSYSQSVVSAGSSNILSGGSMTVTLTIKDTLGSVMSGATGKSVVFSRSGGTGSGTFTTVTDNGNGTYSSWFIGTASGTPTSIGATIDGVPVTSAAPAVTVNPGLVSLSNSTISVASSTVQSGNSVNVTLTLKDAFGNNLTTGGSSVSFSHAGGVSTGSFGAVTDNMNGTYTAAFTGSISGTATYIYAVVDTFAVTSGSPSITVSPGVYSLAASTVTVSSSTAVSSGSPVTVTLYLKDAAGNQLLSGGPVVAFSHSGGTSTGTFGAVTDNGNGTYTSAFTGVLAGTATSIGATIAAASVTSAQPSVTVTPGAFSIASSTISIANPSMVYAGTTSMNLVAMDAVGNRITTGGLSVGNIGIQVGGGTSGVVSGGFTDNGDGTYTTTLTANQIGSAVAVQGYWSGAGAGATIDSKSVTVNQINLSIGAGYPSAGANWNDYVQYGSSSYPPWLQPTDVPCSGVETGYYGEIAGCIHGGEIRKVVVPGVSSCTNLSATDSLGAFDWQCESGSGIATFYSKLKSNKGLRDLVSATSWNNNSVSVVLSGSTIGVSTPSAWWTNAVAAIPTNLSSVVDLNAPGTVYTVSGSPTSSNGYRITQPRVSVVTLASGYVARSSAGGSNFTASFCFSGSPSVPGLVCSDQKFLWIEATMDGTAAIRPMVAILMGPNARYNRITNTKITNLALTSNTMAAIEIDGDSNLVVDSSARTFGILGGLYLNGSKNTVRKFSASTPSDPSQFGNLMSMSAASTSNRLYDITLANNNGAGGYGLQVSGNNHIVNGLFVSNVVQSGVYVTNSDGVTMSNVVATATGDAGVTVDGTSLPVNNLIIRDMTATNNVYNALYIDGSVNMFVHNLVSFNTDKAIQSPGGSGNVYLSNVTAAQNGSNVAVDIMPGLNVTFAGYFDKGIGSPTCSSSTLTSTCQIGATVYATGVATGFLAKVSTNDVANLDDTNGIASSASSINYWTVFDSVYRAFGKYNATVFPASGHIGACYAGQCQIWDWRANPAGPLYYRGDVPTTAMSTFIGGSACPTEVAGGNVFGSAGKTFLKHAIEINDDDVGNNDGLCESNERCIYAPNRGAYQGEGSYTANGTCSFTNATVTGVTMYTYPP